MHGIIVSLLTILGTLSPSLKAKAQLARIGRYYATQSMLSGTPPRKLRRRRHARFGTDRLEDHYAAMLRGEVADDRGAHAIF
jgi:divinyl chlorophyllide a 8-vinyl-reductase